MTWRDEQYFRRWEQEILEKLRNIDTSLNCNEIKPSEEDFATKVEFNGQLNPVCIKFKKTKPTIGFSKKKLKESRQFCNSCDFVANRDRPFQRHQFEEHGRSLCGECGSHFTDFKTYYKHILTHYEQVICPHCPEQFPTARRLNRHIEAQHEVNESKRILQAEKKKSAKPCPICGDLIQSSNITNHIKRHSAPSTCPHCGKMYKSVQDHIERTQCNVPKEQRVLDVVTCQFCTKQLQKMNLKIHIKKMHSTSRNLQCDLCEFKTKHSFNFLRHKRRMHDHKSLKENCPKCKKPCFNVEWHLSVYHTDE